MTAKSKKGRSAEQAEALRRTYGDLEVRDATHDLRIPITSNDVKKAERKNPERCALAQACMREFASSAAVFFKSRAYVDLVNEDGVRRVERFIMGPEAREVVEAFDRGKPVPTGGRWLVLKAPTPGTTLRADRQRNKRRKRALRKGEITPKPGRNGASKRGTPRDLEVRNGTGQWQMIQQKRGGSHPSNDSKAAAA
jgi:hypothetical protein